MPLPTTIKMRCTQSAPTYLTALYSFATGLEMVYACLRKKWISDLMAWRCLPLGEAGHMHADNIQQHCHRWWETGVERPISLRVSKQHPIAKNSGNAMEGNTNDMSGCGPGLGNDHSEEIVMIYCSLIVRRDNSKRFDA